MTLLSFCLPAHVSSPSSRPKGRIEIFLKLLWLPVSFLQSFLDSLLPVLVCYCLVWQVGLQPMRDGSSVRRRLAWRWRNRISSLEGHSQSKYSWKKREKNGFLLSQCFYFVNPEWMNVTYILVHYASHLISRLQNGREIGGHSLQCV